MSNDTIEAAVRNLIEEASPTEPLPDEEYIECMQKLGLAAALIADLPVQRALATVRRVDTLAPMLDPTAWMRGGARNLDEARTLLEPAVRFALAVRGLRKVALERQARAIAHTSRSRDACGPGCRCGIDRGCPGWSR